MNIEMEICVVVHRGGGYGVLNSGCFLTYLLATPPLTAVCGVCLCPCYLENQNQDKVAHVSIPSGLMNDQLLPQTISKGTKCLVAYPPGPLLSRIDACDNSRTAVVIRMLFIHIVPPDTL